MTWKNIYKQVINGTWLKRVLLKGHFFFVSLASSFSCFLFFFLVLSFNDFFSVVCLNTSNFKVKFNPDERVECFSSH